MTPLQFVRTLQLADSFFPVGAFAYSDGLESAVAQGSVRDAADLESWMHHYIDAVFVACDGPALLQVMRAAKKDDWEAIRRVDEELTALKPASGTRASSRSAGKRLLAMYISMVPDTAFRSCIETLPNANAAAAYGVVFAHQGVDDRSGLLAFGYMRLAGIVSCGLRLIPLGQQQGHRLLMGAGARLPAAAEQALHSEAAPLRCFSPLLDIRQMNHPYTYSRLFRS